MSDPRTSEESTNAGGRAASLNTCPGLATSPSSSPDGLDGGSSLPAHIPSETVSLGEALPREMARVRGACVV